MPHMFWECNRLYLMSDYFDFDEETFRNIMVHEMIHCYLYLNGESNSSTILTTLLQFVLNS